MLKTKLAILFILLSIFLKAQSPKEIIKQIDSIKEQLNEGTMNPDTGIEVITRLYNDSRKINYTEGKVRSGILLIGIYNRQDNAKKVLETGRQIEKDAKILGDNYILSEIYLKNAVSYGELGFLETCLKEFETALKYAKKIKDNNLRHYKMAMLYENKVFYFHKNTSLSDSIPHYLAKSIKNLEQIKDNNSGISIASKYDMIIYCYFDLGLYYMETANPPKMDSAEIYLLKGKQIYEDHNDSFADTYAYASNLSILAKFYYKNKNYKAAIENSEAALRLGKNSISPNDKIILYKILTKSYLAVNDLKNSQLYMGLYTNFSDSIYDNKKLTTQTTLKNIISHKTKEYKSNVRIILMLVTGFIIVAVAITGFFWKKSRKKMQEKHNLLIEKLTTEKRLSEIRTTDSVKGEPKTDGKSKELNITDATLNELLSNLEKFENSNDYLNEDVNLAYLANHLSTNIKYLSQVIKQHKGKSFSNYINGLRINHIINLLYQDSKYQKYKTSYLAKICGFSSREVFTRAFKKETGISPSYFMERLKKDNKSAQKQ